MDGNAFASLAQIRILIIPVGQISGEAYEQWASIVRSFEHIRLDEIPQETREDKSRFMTSALLAGHLHLSYPMHPPPEWHASLGLFQPSHFPLGVIGVAQYSDQVSMTDIAAEFKAIIGEYFPTGSPFPFATKCYAFESGDSGTAILGSTTSEVIVIPSLMGHKEVYVGTLISQMCADILGYFAGMAQALESPASLEALNGRLFPMLAQAGETNGTDIMDPQHRVSSPAIITSSSFGALSAIREPGNTGSPPALNGAGRPQVKRSSTISALNRTSIINPRPGTATKRATILATSNSTGRLNKIMGDLYLLSGRTADAVQWYIESLPMLRGSQDVVWHASAIEGMCVAEVLDAWSSGDGAQPAPAGSKQPWMDISERLNQAIQLYARATPTSMSAVATHTTPGFPPDEELTALSYLYSQSVLRHTNFLMAIWADKGWCPAALRSLLQGSRPESLDPDIVSEAYLCGLSTVATISRATISATVSQAHGPHIMHLQPSDRLRTLNAIAATYSCLGFKRKEVFVLREVLASVMDMLVTAREEASRTTTNNGQHVGLGIPGAELPVTPAAPPLDSKRTTGSLGNVVSRENVNDAGNESVLKLVRYVCGIYGVDLTKVGIVEANEIESQEQVDDIENDDVSTLSPGDGVDRFGWPDLQLGVVREAVAIAEALPDYPAVTQFSLSTLKAMYADLSPVEQSYLYTTSAKALATTRRRGDDRRVDYWAGRPVLSLEVTTLPLVRLPIEHPMQDLEPPSSSSLNVVSGRKDPFIYNPRLKATLAKQAIVVQNEPVDIALTLYNPFSFDLDIQSLAISTSGLEFVSPSIATLIPSESFRVVHVSGIASKVGTLTIRGVKAQLSGGIVQEFLLPINSTEEDTRAERRKSALNMEVGRVKYTGLDARNLDRTSQKRMSAGPERQKAPTKVASTFLTCKVIEAQPLLRVRRSSLTHSALTLYEGETTLIRLALENVSGLPTDFLKLTFDDSTVPIAQHALAEGELSDEEVYETEYDLIHRPVFTWDGGHDHRIEPGRNYGVGVTCLGKAGCSGATIHLSYSYARRPSDIVPQVFQTRQIVYPVDITVYSVLDCRSLDIIPHWRTQGASCAQATSLNQHDVDRQVLEVGEEDDWCLFAIDVHNKHDTPFQVTIKREQEGVPQASTSRLTGPGAIARMIIPLRRLTLSSEITSQPIPTLSERQFVVSKSKMSPSQEQTQREMFWYREHLLKCVKATWVEPGSMRRGELSLRSQRLTPATLEALRTTPCHIELSLVAIDEGTKIARRASHFITQPHCFVYLRANVQNTSGSPLNLALSYIPSNLIVLDSALFDGSPSQISLGTIEASASAHVEIGVCFVDHGLYEFKAIMDEINKGPISGLMATISIQVEGD
ncbi:hypothetical protein FRB93_006471 [Tulasnella sp. JGI-2019a]|nr:hypothetical protein FRB93_006471 [Tulasnella sp. JGI-2019a]